VAQRRPDWCLNELPGQHVQRRSPRPSADAHRPRLQIRSVRRIINGAFRILRSSLNFVQRLLWRRVEDLGQVVAFQPFEAVVDDADSADILESFSIGRISAEKSELTW